jgi:2-keto-3-deoxy-L-rhamnonate aldolase RhmA
MLGRDLQQALRKRDFVFGICLEGYGQPRWPRFFAQMGLDYVFLDTEHTPQNRETLAWAAQAYAAAGIGPLVRIPAASTAHANQALDLGAHGILVPYLETVPQVRDMVGVVKYRPLKGKLLENILEKNTRLDNQTSDYLAKYNRDAVLLIMIESLAGVDNLDDILAFGGVDGVLIGPHDLSISSGLPEQYEHPRYLQIIEEVFKICQKHNTSAGMHVSWGDLKYEKGLIQKGCNIILHSSDTICIANHITKELRELKAHAGLDVPPDVIIDGKKGHAL